MPTDAPIRLTGWYAPPPRGTPPYCVRLLLGPRPAEGRPVIDLLPGPSDRGILVRQMAQEDTRYPGVKLYGAGVFSVTNLLFPADPADPTWFAGDVTPGEAARLAWDVCRLDWRVASGDPHLNGHPARWAAWSDRSRQGNAGNCPVIFRADILRALGA